MAKRKLILLEGIPGAGKTTAGSHLQTFLQQLGCSVRFWREGNFDNPAGFEGVARLSKLQYRVFLTRDPQLTELLRAQLTINDADYLLNIANCNLYIHRKSLKLWLMNYPVMMYTMDYR